MAYPELLIIVMFLFLTAFTLFCAWVVVKSRDDAMRPDSLDERVQYYVAHVDLDPTTDEEYDLMESNGAVNRDG